MTNEELRCELLKSLVNEFCNELKKINNSNNPNLLLIEVEVLEDLREKYDVLEFENKVLNRIIGVDDSVLPISQFVKFKIRKKYLNENH